MALLFVYGSLKEGFPNFHANKGRRVAGEFRTAQPHELWLFNGELPCLFPSTGTGQRVRGQLFEVSAEELATMDALERVGEPGGYRRLEIEVEQIEGQGQDKVFAFIYAQDPKLLQGQGEHIGPIAEYTSEHAKRLRW